MGDLNQTPLNSSSIPLSTSVMSASETTRTRGEDLFTAHDFDISIDLPTTAQGILTCMYLQAQLLILCEQA